MSLISEIKELIEKNNSELKWLKDEINSFDDVNENMLDSRFEDVEISTSDLVCKVEILIDTIEELI